VRRGEQRPFVTDRNDGADFRHFAPYYDY
jgi:hypothetical protein